MNERVLHDDLAMLVDGAMVNAPERVAVINPSLGVEFTSVPVASADLLDRAVFGAVRASRDWSSDAAGRRALLTTIADIIESNAAALAECLRLEIGLPEKLAVMEISAGAGYMRYRASSPAQVDTISDTSKEQVIVVRKPVGVVGAILPWNAPFLIACEKIASAFGAGNTVVMKPSLYAPVTLLYLGGLLRDVVPAGALNIVTGDDRLGAALVAHPNVGMISFTGSIPAGKAIMANAASGLKRLSLELGGNDAAIVMPDVDVGKVASRLLNGAFFRSGQVCAAIKRLYAHADIFDELTAALVRAAEKMNVGDPSDPKVTMGPISNGAQFERVCALVDRAVADGATVLTGGRSVDRAGYFYQPTLITGVADDSDIVTQEQFGPVLPILRFSDLEDVVERVNCTPFGLGNSVWTSDANLGSEIASRLESGSVWVNRHGIVLPHVPFGGMKQSGVGRTNGAPGTDLYSELQTISVARS